MIEIPCERWSRKHHSKRDVNGVIIWLRPRRLSFPNTHQSMIQKQHQISNDKPFSGLYNIFGQTQKMCIAKALRPTPSCSRRRPQNCPGICSLTNMATPLANGRTMELHGAASWLNHTKNGQRIMTENHSATQHAHFSLLSQCAAALPGAPCAHKSKNLWPEILWKSAVSMSCWRDTTAMSCVKL